MLIRNRLGVTTRIFPFAAVFSAAPSLALAECLGDGCYDGLGLFIFGVAAAALAVVVAIIFGVIKLWKTRGPLWAIGVFVVAASVVGNMVISIL